MYKRAARPEIGRKAVWIIRDGGRDFATGCIASPSDKGPPEAAQQALADHIATKYRPERKTKTIETIDIADLLTIYVDDKGDVQASRSKFEGRILRLNAFWGGRMLSEVSTATCKEYARARGSKWVKSADGQERIVGAGGARRDLEDLRAAIGHHAAENLHREIVNVWLPPKGAPRDRWLSRSEAAKLIWTCWRCREIQTCHRGPLKGQKIQTDKRPLRHLARFLLVGLYTGTRAGAIATASPIRGIGRSFVDLDGGIFYRLAQGRRERQQAPAARTDSASAAGPHAALGSARHRHQLLRRMARQAGQIGQDRPDTATRLAKLSNQAGNVTPHTLRHTAATWLMQAGVPVWTAAGYLGMSVEVLLNTYGHHHPDPPAGSSRCLRRQVS